MGAYPPVSSTSTPAYWSALPPSPPRARRSRRSTVGERWRRPSPAPWSSPASPSPCGRESLERQTQRVGQELGEWRRRPAGADEAIEKVGCARLVLRECMAGRKVGTLEVLHVRMLPGISTRHGLQRAAFHREPGFERPGGGQRFPALRIGHDRVAHPGDGGRLRVPDADPAVNGARLEVEVEAWCRAGPVLVRKVDGAGGLVWGLVFREADVAVEAEDRAAHRSRVC